MGLYYSLASGGLTPSVGGISAVSAAAELCYIACGLIPSVGELFAVLEVCF